MATASLLRCFCQGTKVCFEIVLMATDAGHVKTGEKVIAIAGTGRGFGHGAGHAGGVLAASEEAPGQRDPNTSRSTP